MSGNKTVHVKEHWRSPPGSDGGNRGDDDGTGIIAVFWLGLLGITYIFLEWLFTTIWGWVTAAWKWIGFIASKVGTTFSFFGPVLGFFWEHWILSIILFIVFCTVIGAISDDDE
jgi:hypothetical protein